jgi:hypothetical protein
VKPGTSSGEQRHRPPGTPAPAGTQAAHWTNFSPSHVLDRAACDDDAISGSRRQPREPQPQPRFISGTGSPVFRRFLNFVIHHPTTPTKHHQPDCLDIPTQPQHQQAPLAPAFESQSAWQRSHHNHPIFDSAALLALPVLLCPPRLRLNTPLPPLRPRHLLACATAAISPSVLHHGQPPRYRRRHRALQAL